MHRRQFLVAVAGAFPAASVLRAGSAQSANVRQWRAVRRMVNDYVSSGKLAGAVASVSYHGQPLTHLPAGRIALDSSIPFDENSICRIYSMSKPVTGIAAMTLMEDGAADHMCPLRPACQSLPYAVADHSVVRSASRGIEARRADGVPCRWTERPGYHASAAAILEWSQVIAAGWGTYHNRQIRDRRTIASC